MSQKAKDGLKVEGRVPSEWNRFTVADGNWLNDKDIKPFSARDEWLAECIDDLEDTVTELGERKTSNIYLNGESAERLDFSADGDIRNYSEKIGNFKALLIPSAGFDGWDTEKHIPTWDKDGTFDWMNKEELASESYYKRAKERGSELPNDDGYSVVFGAGATASDNSIAANGASAIDGSFAFYGATATDHSVAWQGGNASSDSVAWNRGSAKDNSIAWLVSNASYYSIAWNNSTASGNSVAWQGGHASSISIAWNGAMASSASVAWGGGNASSYSVAWNGGNASSLSVAWNGSTASDNSIAWLMSNASSYSIAWNGSTASGNSVAWQGGHASSYSVAWNSSTASDNSVAWAFGDASSYSVAWNGSTASDNSVAWYSSTASSCSVAIKGSNVENGSIGVLYSSANNGSIATNYSSAFKGSTAIGYKLESSAGEVILGKYNAFKGDAGNFVVGLGTSEDNRRNGFIIGYSTYTGEQGIIKPSAEDYTLVYKNSPYSVRQLFYEMNDILNTKADANSVNQQISVLQAKVDTILDILNVSV